MRSFAIVICRAYFEAKKRRKYAKNVVVNISAIFWHWFQENQPLDLGVRYQISRFWVSSISVTGINWYPVIVSIPQLVNPIVSLAVIGLLPDQ